MSASTAPYAVGLTQASAAELLVSCWTSDERLAVLRLFKRVCVERQQFELASEFRDLEKQQKALMYV